MGGFLSALSGAGAAAAPYREHVLDRWERTRDHALQFIEGEMARTADQGLRSQLSGLHAQIGTAVPGKDITPIMKKFQDLTMPHPGTVQALQSIGAVDKPPAPPTSTPGPPAPGTPPGGGLSQFLSAPKEAPAAQPGSSLVAPTGEQIGAHAGVPAQPTPLPNAAPSVPAVTPVPNAAPATPPIQPVAAAAPANDVDSMYHAALASHLPIPDVLSTAHQPFALNEAQLAHQKATDQYLINTYGPQRVEAIKQSIGPAFDALSPIQKTQVIQAAFGMTPLQMPASLYNRELSSAFTSGANLPPGTIVEGGGPPDPNKNYRVERDRMTGQQIAYPTDVRSDFTQRVVTGNNGQQSFVSPHEAQGGSAGTPIPGALNPSFASTSTTSPRSVQDVDPATGMPVTRLVDVTTTRTKGGRSAAPTPTVPPVGGTGAPPPAPDITAPPPRSNGRTFQKPLTPEQILKSQQQLGQFNQVEGRVKEVLQDLPLLESMLTAGKIQLNTDPTSGFVKSAINRSLPLSQQEERLAANMVSLMEDINVLRIPLGAAGFRGPEGWAALQSMHGNVLARPGITARVLANTMRALRAQEVPLRRALGKAAEGIGEEGAGGGAGGDQVEDWHRDPKTGKLVKGAATH